MKLRMTKGVGIALAIAAGCAVMGFLMAPGWWFFAAFSAWWGLVLAAGGQRNPHAISRDGLAAWSEEQRLSPSSAQMSPNNIWRR